MAATSTTYGELTVAISTLKGHRGRLARAIDAARAGRDKALNAESTIAAMRDAGGEAAASAKLLEASRRGLLAGFNGAVAPAQDWIKGADAALAVTRDPASIRALEYARDASWLTRYFMSTPLPTFMLRARPYLADFDPTHKAVESQVAALARLNAEIDRQAKKALGADWESRVFGFAKGATGVVTGAAGSLIKSASLPLVSIGIGAAVLGLVYLVVTTGGGAKMLAGKVRS